MNRSLAPTRSSRSGVARTVGPALAQDQQEPENLDKLAGVYEFEAADYGVISVVIELTEEKDVTISAMGAVPSVMKHVEGNLWEFDSPDFGFINIGFVEEDDGSVSAITIDSYDFSFIAFRKKQ